jgi:NAD(P)-dependent dehydrogenase (short-subunit alcohol dehydrogenase family)
MLKREKGSIVNVGSISSVVGLMMQSIYAPAKAGILQLTRTAAIDYARNGIRVNCVLPGGMHTPMFEDELAKAPRELVEKERELQPMGRFADPREVAYVILFLAGDEASYVNGAGWSVDGGYTAQ